MQKTQEEKDVIAAQLLELRVDVSLRYGVDLAMRSIQLVGEIDEGMFCYLDSAMTLLESSGNTQIKLKINSEGGSVYDALAIVGRMRNSKCKIVTEGYGSIMSAASLILAAGDKRRMSEFAWLLHHEMSYAVDGTHEQIKHLTQQREREEDAWAQSMTKFTQSDVQFWKQTGKSGKDLYLNAEECKNLGIVDEVF